MVQMSIGLDIQKIYLYFSVYKQMPVYIFAYIFTAMPQQGMIVRALELFDRTTQFFLSFFSSIPLLGLLAPYINLM